MRADRRLHLQTKRNTCAVAALRTVLDLQFGCKVGEAALELAGESAAEPITTHGVGPGELRRMLAIADRAFNPGRLWRLRIKCKATFADIGAELQAGRKPILTVGGVDGPGTHVVVALAIDGARIRVFDPDRPERPNGRWASHRVFRAHWLDATSGETRMEVVVGKDS